jgi:hypothetical protein
LSLPRPRWTRSYVRVAEANFQQKQHAVLAQRL